MASDAICPNQIDMNRIDPNPDNPYSNVQQHFLQFKS